MIFRLNYLRLQEENLTRLREIDLKWYVNCFSYFQLFDLYYDFFWPTCHTLKNVVQESFCSYDAIDTMLLKNKFSIKRVFTTIPIDHQNRYSTNFSTLNFLTTWHADYKIRNCALVFVPTISDVSSQNLWSLQTFVKTDYDRHVSTVIQCFVQIMVVKRLFTSSW